MKKILSPLFISFFLLTGCNSPASISEKTGVLEGKEMIQNQAPDNKEEAIMQAAKESEIDSAAGRPPQPEPAIEPIDVNTLPFFQETEDGSTADPEVLKAASAKSAEECKAYQANLKEICERAVGFSPNYNPAETPVN